MYKYEINDIVYLKATVKSITITDKVIYELNIEVEKDNKRIFVNETEIKAKLK